MTDVINAQLKSPRDYEKLGALTRAHHRCIAFRAVNRSFLLLLFALVACGARPLAPDGGTACVDPPTTCTRAALQYADVKPIFDRRCATCHRASDPNGPWPL